jgi:hypothetical protein
MICVLAAACGHSGDPIAATSNTPPPPRLRGALSTAPASTSSSESVRPPTTVPAPPMYPLTGQLIDDPNLANHPAVVVKIDNHPDARPHTGLRYADIVYELKVEGITRFAAVYHSQDADPVGPVRSARSSDIDIVSNLNKPFLLWSGGNPGVTGEVKGAESVGLLVDLSEDVAAPFYFRGADRPAPHNLYAHMTAIRNQMALAGGIPPFPMFAYRNTDEPQPSTAIDVPGMTIDFTGGVKVNWVWDAERNGWDRFQVDQSHPVGRDAFDDSDGAQVAPQNVVIMDTLYGASDVDARSPKAFTVGEGDALVLTGGKGYNAHWKRDSVISMPILTDTAGNQIGLTPGKTWIELPPAFGPPKVPIDGPEALAYLARRS